MPEWIGKTIGNVRIDKLLARGGMAEVYLGLHRNLDRLVAIKLLHSYIEEEQTNQIQMADSNPRFWKQVKSEQEQ